MFWLLQGLRLIDAPRVSFYSGSIGNHFSGVVFNYSVGLVFEQNKADSAAHELNSHLRS